MNVIAEALIEQLVRAQRMGRRILSLARLNVEGVIYAYATADMLVINCRDYETAWLMDGEQDKLLAAIVQVKSSIQTIVIEKGGETLYCW